MRATCENLGLGTRFSRLRKLRIGNAAEPRGAHPSGGERRRIHIAHELLSRPEVLFLDEPTSGLSATDAELVMTLLRNLAREEGMNVILTIHQPSREMFGRLDDLILISLGGRLAYYGDSARAADYFQHAGKVRMAADRNPADFVMEFIPDDRDAVWAERTFQDELEAGGFVFLKAPEEP
jgi:ABC-type multidrug transport system ATPase subunit